MLVAAVLGHAALMASADEECCGVLSRVPGGPWVSAHALANVAPSRQHNYAFDPVAQVELWTSLSASGLVVGAIYHSHNYGVPTPSPLDLRQWHYPEVGMYIAHKGRLYGWCCVNGTCVGGRIFEA